MKQLINSVFKLVIGAFNVLGKEISNGIEHKNGKQVLVGLYLLLLLSVACFGAFVVVGGGGLFLLFHFWPITLPGSFVVAGIYRLIHSGTLEEKTEEWQEDPVEEELTIERARDISPRIEELGYLATQEASSNTPLVRPRSISDVQSSTARSDHFYMVKVDDGTKITSVPIHQIECELDAPVDVGQITPLRETVQRCVTKQSIRFPDLTDYGAKGGPAIEVLDITPLGSHVVIELVQRTAASIPLIDARRRVRVERRQKQQTYIDADYTE